jgi:hypothetical protein
LGKKGLKACWVTDNGPLLKVILNLHHKPVKISEKTLGNVLYRFPPEIKFTDQKKTMPPKSIVWLLMEKME